MLGLLTIPALLRVWWLIATDYSEKWLSGTYMLHEQGVRATLILRPDGSFHEDVLGEITQTADGSWRRIGEGGVDFTGLLALPGAKTYAQEFPNHLSGTSKDQDYCGHFERVLGVFPELHINANPPGPT